MKNLRIYAIMILAVLLLAVFLPNYFKDFFSKSINKYNIYYSPVDEDFIKMTINRQSREVIYSNLDETEKYSLDVYKSKLPFIFYSDILKINKFPEKFSAYAQDPMVIRSEKSYLRIKPEMVKTNIVNLFPLFESNPKYASLEMPKDLFSIGKKGMIFIDTQTNSINKQKSQLYNKKLKELGAIFPLEDAFGTPSTRKPFDEGYFIKDSKYNIFHVKQIDAKAYIKKIDTKGMKTKFILNKEDRRKEYYGALLTENQEIYLLMYGDYELVKLPIENFDYNNDVFKLMTTPLNRIITIESIDNKKLEKTIKTIVTNLDYEVLKTNTYSYSLRRGEFYEKMKSWLIPYKIYLIKGKEGFYSFALRDISKNAFIFYFLLAMCLLVYVKLSKREIKNHLIQALMVAFGGVYSIIVLLLFNKLLTIRPINTKEGK